MSKVETIVEPTDGERFRLWRRRMRWTRKQLAAVSGASLHVVRAYEDGEILSDEERKPLEPFTKKVSEYSLTTADYLKIARERLGYTQPQIGALMGVDWVIISAMEAGKIDPSEYVYKLRELCYVENDE